MLSEKMNLRIKLLTIPFTEIEFFWQDYIEEMACYRDKKTFQKFCKQKILKNLYSIINKRYKITNIDEIDMLFYQYFKKDIIDEIYTCNFNISEYYLEFLTNLSKIFLSHRNGKIVIKYWETEREQDILGPYNGIYKVVLWNSLNRMFTTDLLVILYLLSNGMDEEWYLQIYHNLVGIEDLQLEQVLNKGVAETHLHLKAGIDFIIIWQKMMNPSSERDYDEIKDFDSIIGKQFGLINYIKIASIIRIILAFYLNEYTELQNQHTIDTYYKLKWNKLNFFDINLMIEQIYNGDREAVIQWSTQYIYDEIKNFYLKEIKEEEEKQISWGKYLARQDILRYIFNIHDDYSVIENTFLFRCIKYTKSKPKDLYFSKLFWQYIRIKNEVFQLKVQGNSVKGLENFKEYYKRSTKTSFNSIETIGLVLHTQLQNTNLKKLELRTGIISEKSLSKTKNSLTKALINFFKVYRDIAKEMTYESTGEERRIQREIPSLGLIFHFIKAPDSTGIEKCWMNYNGRESGEVYFKQAQNEYLMQIQAINELREKIVGLSSYIVGIDAASSENDTEPWVFAPVYEAARNSDMQKIIYRKPYSQPIRNLGFTFHVGEDFRHILTGLRRIHEVIVHFKFHAGDRIGHGIALGLDIEKWASSNNVIILPRLEYLENLIWLWGIYKDGNKIENIDLPYLERRILMLAEEIYKNMNGISVYSLWKCYQRKFKSFNVNKKYIFDNSCNTNALFCRCVDERHCIIWDDEKLSYAQHCKCYLKYMTEPIQIEIQEKELDIFKSVQQLVFNKVVLEGIVVETNPTSNRVIGQISNIFEHYIINRINNNYKQDLIMTINTDDPSVFNTNINNEFAYIFYSLIEKKYSRAMALEWIDNIRENGMKTSFIETRFLNNEQRIGEIEYIIKQLEDEIK